MREQDAILLTIARYAEDFRRWATEYTREHGDDRQVLKYLIHTYQVELYRKCGIIKN